MAKKRVRPWQLQEAKARFSEVFDLAFKGTPQTVTRRGKDSVIMLSRDQYQELCGAPKETLLSFLMRTAPKIDFEIPEFDDQPFAQRIDFNDPEFRQED